MTLAGEHLREATYIVKLTQRTLIAGLVTGTTNAVKGILADSTYVILIFYIPHPITYGRPILDCYLHRGKCYDSSCYDVEQQGQQG